MLYNKRRRWQQQVIFSGDAFNPSMLSTVTKGKHMVPVLNEMMIDAATIGNHDFDFGVENLMTHVEATNFPWMLASTPLSCARARV